jgi:hypothetical protein
MAQLPLKLLLVEGQDELRVIPQLIEKATELRWGESRDRKPRLVEIKVAGSVSTLLSSKQRNEEGLLEPGYIETELKTANLHSLGVLLDADLDVRARWQALRDRCLERYPDFPKEPLPQGLVLTPALGPRLGAWLMPNNLEPGMLETFLLTLCPQSYSPDLWQYAQDAVAHVEKRTNGQPPWKPTHRDKALVHTFLAWQDPPGRQMHEAVMENLLDVKGPAAKSFVDWFRRLYEV